MAHRLNTNKQFMIGNGILAFAVIFVVVIFVYMSMRLQQRKEGERNFIETYTITQRQPAGEPYHCRRTFHHRSETLCRAKRTHDCKQCN